MEDLLGVGAAVGQIADEVSEVIDSMDRPIIRHKEEYKRGKKKVTREYNFSKLDIIMIAAMAIMAVITLIQVMDAMPKMPRIPYGPPNLSASGGMRPGAHVGARL